jgi:ATP-binding cassette, subfamily B, bacterial
MQSLASAPVEFATSMVSFERVFEVIDLPVDIGERADAITLTDTSGEIVFEDVTFKYEVGDEYLLSAVHRYGSMDNVNAVLSGERPVVEEEEHQWRSQARGNALDQVSFRVEPGQLVALVGPSGAGKTTLTYLIPALYDPSEGAIRIDGHDLRDVTLVSLSGQIGMVTQETYLFHDTIRTNLLYAKLDATRLSWKPPAGPPTFTTSSASCRMVTIRLLASAATA